MQPASHGLAAPAFVKVKAGERVRLFNLALVCSVERAVDPDSQSTRVAVRFVGDREDAPTVLHGDEADAFLAALGRFVDLA